VSITLTDRDLDLLETLTSRVRLLSMRQVASIWWPGHTGRDRVRRRLRRFAAIRFIELHRINLRSLPALSRPLFAWQPGRDEPDAESLSDRLRNRWTAASRPVEVCVAAPATANLFASTAYRLPRLEHRDHDFLLAAVYVHYRSHRSELASAWIGEHVLPKAGYCIKDPDAFLRSDDGRIVRVIEAAGRYSAEHIVEFHEHCVENDLPYELW
jgi:hypothetical protein